MKYFSKGIFREGLRQITPYAVLLTVFYLIISAVYMVNAVYYPPQEMFRNVSVTAFIPELSASVFTLTAFDFIFKRKSADFFGAVSERKEAKTVSLFCAVLFQSFMPVLTVTLPLTVIGCFCIPEILSFLEILLFLIKTLIGCFLFSSATFLGITVMNRSLSGLLAGMLFIGLPTWILQLFYEKGTITEIKNLGSLKAENEFFSFLDANFFLNAKALPYMIILGVLCLISGICVFSQKGYESAGGKISQRIQVLFNVLCAASVGMFCIYIEGEATLVTVLLFFMLLVAVVTDMICSRTVKTIGRGLVSACIALGTVFLLTSICTFEAKLMIKNYMTVESFYIVGDSNTENADVHELVSFEYKYRYYLKKKGVSLAKIKITDDEITEFLENLINNQPREYDQNRYTKVTLRVKIPSGAVYDSIRINVSKEDYEELLEMIFQKRENLEKTYSLEEYSRKLRVCGQKKGVTALSDEKEIYQVFYEEYNGLSPENRRYITDLSEKNINESYISLSVYRPWGSDAHFTTYKITRSYFPKTFDLLKSLGWKTETA